MSRTPSVALFGKTRKACPFDKDGEGDVRLQSFSCLLRFTLQRKLLDGAECGLRFQAAKIADSAKPLILHAVQNEAARDQPERASAMALTLLSGTALAAGEDTTKSRVSPAASAQWHLLYGSGSGARFLGLRFLKWFDFGRRG